jgi:Cu/Ag efflux protein CusF
MALSLTLKATEESTYIITCDFEDEDGNAIPPKTMTWTLSDADGNIINEKEDVEVTDPQASQDVTLKGDDLQAVDNDDFLRVFTVKATYDSEDYGNDLPFNGEIAFTLEDLVNI